MPRRPWILVVAAGLVYLVWAALYVERTSFVVDGRRVFCLWDDGMISMQYARNLARGHGLVWNASEAPVQGYSDLGVTLIMAALHRLPLRGQHVALAVQVVEALLLGGIAALTWGLARRCCPDEPAIAVAATLGALVSAPLAVWSLQGADPAFVALWLLGSLYAMADPRRSDRPWPWWLLAWLGAGLLIRIDAVLPFVVLVLFGAGPARRSRWWPALGVLLVVGGGELWWAHATYGAALPNTYDLKATGSPRALVLQTGLSQLGQWALGLVPSLAIAGWAAWRRRGEPLVRTMAALVMATLAYCVWVGGDWAPQLGNRFFVPCLPLLAIGVAAGLHPLVERALVDWTLQRRRWGLVVAAVAIALIGNPSDAAREWFSTSAPTLYHRYNVRNYRRARYLVEHTDPGVLVAVHWAGVPIYFGERRGLDVLGKSDRHIARLTVDRFSPGHSKWDWDYVVEQRRPEVILMTSRGLAEHPGFVRDYLAVVSGGETRLYVRRDAVGVIHDPDATFEDPQD